MNGPPVIFDRILLRQRKKRAAATLPSHDFLFAEAAVRLVDRLDDVTRRFDHALELGCQGPWLKEALRERTSLLSSGPLSGPYASVVCDEEALPFAPQSFDLVMSVLSLHWVNDLPGTLAQVSRILKPDGLFLAALPGGETLKELREAFDEASMQEEGGVSPRISPFVDVRDAGSLLQRAGFSLPVVDSDRLNVSYENVFTLLADLRGAGEGNLLRARAKKPLSRRTLSRMAEIYRQRFTDHEGRVEATFELVTLTAWKPHASQQQPAKRGSGTISLAKTLKD